jgi:AcrR family transcriptional regulator
LPGAANDLTPPRTRRQPQRTRAQLIEAAIREFNVHGYAGTDTNRIAREAGFAPQTFYRHFPDKLAIFHEIYENWWRAEADAVAIAAGESREALAAAKVILQFHQNWKIFRRSLRTLSVEDERTRRARADGRRSQIQALGQSLSKQGFAQKLGQLLTVERLCDAAAEGELADLGVTKPEALALIVNAVQAYLSPVGDPGQAVASASDTTQVSASNPKRRMPAARVATPARRK